MGLQNELIRQGNFLFKYRSFLPVLLLVGGLCVYILQVKSDRFDVEQSELYFFASTFIGMLGLLVRAIAVGYSADNTSGRNTKAGQIADSLNTKGLYSVVRHPLYVGNLFMWLPFVLVSQSWWFVFSFILIYWLYYERIMVAEESYLSQKFGQEFKKWSEQVPAFIPNILQYEHPIHSFDFKKILRQEKNGLLALGFLMYLFKSIETFIISGQIEFDHWTFYFFVGSLIFYLFFKWGKNKPWMQNQNKT